MPIVVVAVLGFLVWAFASNGQAFDQYRGYENPCPPCPGEYRRQRYRPDREDEEEWRQPRKEQEVTRIEGDITPDLWENFRPAAVIILDSPGGEVGSAIRIGDIIRRSGSTVVVPRGASCLSACAIIWVAAEHRKIEGRVGFHAPHRGGGRYGGMEPAPEAERMIAAAYRQWGLSEEFTRWSMSADPTDMAYLTPKLAQRFNISVEGYEQPEKQSPAPVKASVSLEDINARLERLEKLITERPAPEAPVSRWYRGR